MICNNVIMNSKTDSANCGGCGNVCQAGFKCVNSACERITNLTSTTTITCNAQTVKPYSDRANCAGCGIVCGVGNKCSAGNCVAYAVGEKITFGHYEQDNDTSNGKEPISWIVLDRKSNGEMLIISEKVLDTKPYNTKDTSITWEKSTIRSWLNGYGASYNTVGTSFTSSNFINTAFTTAEKAKIVSSSVPAHANPYSSTSYAGNATTDKIFLLSITEAENYFSSNSARQADATRYAVKRGAQVYGSESGFSYDGSCTDVHCYAYWWLRSPGEHNYKAAMVYTTGNVGLGVGGVLDWGVNADWGGVRPALWVKC